MDELVERMSDLHQSLVKTAWWHLKAKMCLTNFSKRLANACWRRWWAKLVSQLNQEIKAMKLRHEANQGVVKGWIDIGPAMGMIGTLIGCAMLATWLTQSDRPGYGCCFADNYVWAIIANIIFMPMLVKLRAIPLWGELSRIGCDRASQYCPRESPRNIQDQMVANLPPKMQAKLEAA